MMPATAFEVISRRRIRLRSSKVDDFFCSFSERWPLGRFVFSLWICLKRSTLLAGMPVSGEMLSSMSKESAVAFVPFAWLTSVDTFDNTTLRRTITIDWRWGRELLWQVVS